MKTMQKRARRLNGRLLCLALLVAGVLAGNAVAADGNLSFPQTTLVQDTVFRADGTPAAGWMVITWPAFVTADGAAVAAGTTSVKLGSGGNFSVSLAPNAGSQPAGTFYSVTLKLDNGVTSKEAWLVPLSSPATLAAVRAAEIPATMAIQALTSDWASANLVNLTGVQSITGIKNFVAAPSTPDPVNATDVANKEYVDANAGGGPNVARVNAANTWTQGQTFSVPPSVPAPAKSSDVANKGYVDASAGASPAAANTWTASNQFAILNGMLNEAVGFSGSSASTRVASACASLGGSFGVVVIPNSEPSGALTVLPPDNCVVVDERGNSDLNYNNTTINTGAHVYHSAPSTQTSLGSARQTLSVVSEPWTGGSNGDGGNKNNYNALGVSMMRHTPGQSFALNVGSRNSARLGDHYAINAITMSAGNTESGGDDGTGVLDLNAQQDTTPDATGTVSANASGVITVSKGASLYLLGEGRDVIDTSTGNVTASSCSFSGITVNCTSGTLSANLATAFCPGGTGPCGTAGTRLSGAYVEDVSWTNNGHKMIIPIATIDSTGKIATLYYKSEGVVATGTPYNNPFSTGAANFYRGGQIQTGSINYACASGSGTCSFTVSPSSSFSNSDTWVQPLGYGLAIGVIKAVCGQFFPSPANIERGCSGMGVVNNGNAQGEVGYAVAGNFRYILHGFAWTTSPDYGVSLAGTGNFNFGAFYANDSAQNNLINLLGTANSSGVNQWINFDRSGAHNWWSVGNFYASTDRRIAINSVPQPNTTAYFGISAGDSPTQTAQNWAYGAVPNNNTQCLVLSVSGVPNWWLRSDGTRCNEFLNYGASTSWYSDNQATQVAKVNGQTGAASFAKINQDATNNYAGTIAMASGTSASATFSTPFNSAPVCTLTPTSDPSSVGAWWVTTTTSTVTANVKSAGAITFNYVCAGNPN